MNFWLGTTIDWDAIQRIRFANADAEIAPDDKYTKAAINKQETLMSKGMDKKGKEKKKEPKLSLKEKRKEKKNKK